MRIGCGNSNFEAVNKCRTWKQCARKYKEINSVAVFFTHVDMARLIDRYEWLQEYLRQSRR